MAEPYFERLNQIMDRLRPMPGKKIIFEIRHFFSGAALYANGKICASLGPAGLAVKLPAELRVSLIHARKGTEFRFFDKGPIKREYVLLSDVIMEDEEMLADIMDISARFVMSRP